MSKKTKPVSELAEAWLRDPEFLREYEALEGEFYLVEALIDARSRSNLTQEQIAERMGTSRTAFEPEGAPHSGDRAAQHNR